MFYLILKYAFLFVLAALFGFLFGRWWSRRSFIDVTHDFAALSRTADAPWDKVWKRFDTVESSLRDARKDLPAGLEVLQGNLGTLVEQRVNAMRSSLADLDSHLRAQPALSAIPDFAPLQQRLAALEKELQKIPRSGAAVDLRPLESRLVALSSALSERKAVNLAPLEQRIGDMEQALRGLARPQQAQAPEQARLQQRIDALEQALSSIQHSPVPDAESIDARMTRIERALASRSTPGFRKPAGQTTTAQSAMHLSGHNDTAAPRLLESAQFGVKDDLKQISGIGPKLERELNRQGVYYFWQVAGWDEAQIGAMNNRFEAFRGRIERDDWVTQARQLMSRENAASPPRD